jgi:4-hydroxy-4-methyl-2-oxoglutarate aldolase
MTSSIPGFRVFARSAADLDGAVERLLALSPTDLSDAQFGLAAVDGGIHALYADTPRLAGPALTVTISPGNGFMIRKALEFIRPGDVMVVNAFGNRERAVLGANVARDMTARGLRALVVDGVIRDAGSIREIGLPVFARGTTPRSGSDKGGRGEINVPVACGGVVVMPNDLVLADGDGISVVPSVDHAAVIDKAASGARSKHDVASAMEAMLSGDTGLDAALADLGLIEVAGTWAADRASREARPTADAAAG